MLHNRAEDPGTWCTYCGAPDNGTCAYPSEGKPGCFGPKSLPSGPFTLVVHTEREFWAACLWPFNISSLPRVLTPVEITLLREDLRRAVDGPLLLSPKFQRHNGACSNQNVLDLLGAYVGVAECGCRGRTQC